MKTKALLLFFVAFLVYNLNFSAFWQWEELDTVPAKMISFSILSGDGIYLDDYKGDQPVYFLQRWSDHYISSYPIIAGIFSVPVYLPLFVYLKAQNLDLPEHFVSHSFWLEKLSASLWASFAVVIFFYLIHTLGASRKRAFGFALVFAFATQMFSISSQYLWQHGFINLFIIISEFFLIIGIRQAGNRKFRMFIAALCFAVLAFWSRPTGLGFLLLALGAIFWADRGRWKVYGGLVTIGIAIQIVYNLVLYQSVLGSYGDRQSFVTLSEFGTRLLGLLFSPGRGVLWYTPFFILGLVALKRVFSPSVSLTEKTLIVLNSTFFFWLVFVYSTWAFWWGGHSFGDRFFADAAASMTILLYFLLVSNTNQLLRNLAGLLIIYGFFVQVIGVFFYPTSFWDFYRRDVNDYPERLWDVVDTPLARSIASGYSRVGITQLALKLQGLTSPVYRGRDRRCELTLVNDRKVLFYRMVTVRFANTSSVDWITANPYLLSLRQAVITDSGMVQLFLPTFIPEPIIQAGDAVEVTVLFTDPQKGDQEFIIYPDQYGAGEWYEYCRVSVPLTRVSSVQ